MLRRTALLALLVGVAIGLSGLNPPASASQDQTEVDAAAQRKKKRKKKKAEEEEVTQALELPKEPPATVIGETHRLSFRVSPLSSKGLLSQQVRDALKALFRQTRGAAIIKLRAFVAGAGDMRRVQAIVSETFTDRRLPLPALSVVQVGGLPRQGAQVVLESVAVERKTVNPNGLAFISGQVASVEEPLVPMAPLMEKSFAGLRAAVAAARVTPKDVLRITCFLSSLDDHLAVRQRVAAEFPAAALDLVQQQRAPVRTLVGCEAVARLAAAPDRPVRFLDLPERSQRPAYSRVALVNCPKLVLTGTQLAFGYTEPDARLAFQRLGKALEQAGTSFDQVVFSHAYPLSGSIAELVRQVRGEFYAQATPPAGTILPFEGLPSLDASFALDVIAALPQKE